MINICLSANSKYMRYLYITAYSILENNQENDLTIYVFQRDFTQYDKTMVSDLVKKFDQTLVFIDVDIERYNRFPARDRYSLEAYFRFEILSELPKTIDRVIYFDVDMIITGDIAELYNTSVDGYYFAACQDMMAESLMPIHQVLFKRTDDIRYFNSGMMIWNLKELRGHVSFNDFLKAAEELDFNLPCVDQDILNYRYYDRTLYLNPQKYNFMVSTYCRDGWDENIKNDALVLHFTGVNPWIVGPKAPLYRVWWSYAKKTPFYVDLLEEQLRRTEEYIFDKEKQRALVRKDDHLSLSEQLRFMVMLKGYGYVKKALSEGNTNWCIWGVGTLGKAFLELVSYEDAEQYIEAVIDQRKVELKKDLPTHTGIDWLDADKDYTFIVTPIHFSEEIKRTISTSACKNITVITLSGFLRSVMEQVEA